MGVTEWGLVVAIVTLLVAVPTLIVVVRTELENHRRWPRVMWDLRNYATRNRADGGTDHVAELVQFGGTPTSVLLYWTVGFRVQPEEEARLRSYVRGEDRMQLFFDSHDPGTAWLLIAHLPRDDRRWCIVQWVPMYPMGPSASATLESDIARSEARRRSIKGRLSDRWTVIASRPTIRPVGPGGAQSARLPVAKRDIELDEWNEVLSIAMEADPGGYIDIRAGH